MDGIHDLGGRAGFGSVNPEPNEPVFHSKWERSVLTMSPALSIAGVLNIDQFRGEIETIPPHDYLMSLYYEHWLHAFEHCGLEAGILDTEELDRRTRYYLENPDMNPPVRSDPALVEIIRHVITQGAEYRRPTGKTPMYRVGDRVRIRPDASPDTHTRRAGYTRGCIGEVVAAHGAYVFPDANAVGDGEQPEPLYTLRFTADALWGSAADPTVVNHIDVFEPYMSPA